MLISLSKSVDCGAFLLALLALACSGAGSNASDGNGGAGASTTSNMGGSFATGVPGAGNGSGGIAVTTGAEAGGTVAASGGKATGGAMAKTGGKDSGADASGGNNTGGKATGGAATGGAATLGGAPAGGNNTTSKASGGAASTGGSKSASGGAGAGGTPETGGSASGAGGMRASGGSASAGGSGGFAGGTTPVTKSAGCGKTSTLTFGTVPGESGTKVGTGKGGYVTIQSGGQSRGFALRLPDNYDNSKPYWLIFGFHWNGGNSAEVDSGGTNGYWWSYYGLQRKSNNGAIFVAPDGLNAGWANSGGRDLTFTDDMIKLIEDNYCVDTSNIITSGFSYGGGMSYELACARAKVFRAAVIYEGGQLSGCDGGNDPVALWQLQGLTDTTVGMSMATPIRDRFVKNNGCTTQSPQQPANPPPYLNPGGHFCTDYSGCSAGHPVRWCVSQSGHGPGPIDGSSDLYNSCASPPKTCSASCPCTWTPDDVWPWLTGQPISGQTPNATK